MTRTIRLNFDLSLVYGPRTWRVPLVAVMLLSAVGELNSESVTLSTYYPAPSGVYTQMITTGNTFLARDGQDVTIGSGNSLSKLGVNGSVAIGAYATSNAAPANGLIVSGNVGIGVTNPADALDVVGNTGLTGTVSVNGLLDVNGNIDLAAGSGRNGYIKINAANCGAPITKSAGTSPLCTGGQYATFTPGVYVEGVSYQNRAGPYLIAPDQTTKIYQALGNWGGVQSTMTMGIDNTVRYVCCNR